ncbi:glucose-1-dehydrogenase [Capsulimonas corticalis]|uniref:Glucose-1-dehydrogenase n=1 Tax=Capsulimonas corticalis TaxID=2219043 RepID=A0A402CUD0_9BACT|nr:SDR family oxidoreductase [Capsulimonas corticalis]BDI28921.1 glucose-1-dehydrogenase [Capsulimonas corticalis]
MANDTGQRLAGKVAFVTGGDGGLGSAMCKKLAADGAAVAVGWFGKDSSKADAVVKAITDAGGRAIAVEGNVADAVNDQQDIQTVIDQLGGIHIVVNNAGYENDHEFLEMPAEVWRGVIDVNLTGPFLVAQAAARWMAANQTGGVIINISSVHDVIPWSHFAHYCSAKAGLSMLTKCMAVALAEHKIRAVTVCPGAIATPINQNVWGDPELSKLLNAKIPWGRIGQPEDVANVVSFLCGSEAEYINGSQIYVDGAMVQYADFQHGAV